MKQAESEKKNVFFRNFFLKKLNKTIHNFFMGGKLFEILKKIFEKKISTKKHFFFKKKKEKYFFFKKIEFLFSVTI